MEKPICTKSSSLDNYDHQKLLNGIYLLFFSRSSFPISTRGIFLPTIVPFSLTILPFLVATFSNTCGKIKLPTLHVLNAIFCLSCLILPHLFHQQELIQLYSPPPQSYKKKSNMIELTFLKRNFCSFTGFLPYLLKQNLYKMYQYMSFGKVSACNVFENWSSANAYVKFKHFYADVLV